MTLDIERFELLCDEYGAVFYEGSIGTYNEKRLHLILKHLVSSNDTEREVKLGKCVADAFDGERIYEIQTGSLRPLQKKIDYYLTETEYPITLIKPFIASKRIVRLDRESGEVHRCKRSPKKEGDAELFSELYWLAKHLKNDRLEVLATFIEADEYRYSDEVVRYRKSGKRDSELFPRRIVDIKRFCGPETFEYLLEGLDKSFSAREFSAIHKLKGRPLYSTLNLLCELSRLSREKTSSGAYEYTKNS